MNFILAQSANVLLTWSSSKIIIIPNVLFTIFSTGSSCSGIGLPAAQEVRDTDDSVDHASDVEYARSNLAKLNPEQKHLVTTIFSSIEAFMKDESCDEYHAFFLDGPGGTGKTMVYNTLMSTTC